MFPTSRVLVKLSSLPVQNLVGVGRPRRIVPPPYLTLTSLRVTNYRPRIRLRAPRVVVCVDGVVPTSIHPDTTSTSARSTTTAAPDVTVCDRATAALSPRR